MAQNTDDNRTLKERFPMLAQIGEYAHALLAGNGDLDLEAAFHQVVISLDANEYAKYREEWHNFQLLTDDRGWDAIDARIAERGEA